MAVRDDFSAGEVLAAADLNDTFASKLPYSYGTAEPSTSDSGFLWYDSNSTPAATKFWDGSAFVPFGGKILQIVRATDTSNRSTTSTSYVDVTGLSVTITPQKSTSTILLIVSVYGNAASAGGRMQVAITDNSNNLLSGAERLQLNQTSGQGILTGIGYSTPATTSATTYKTRFLVNSGTAEIRGDWNTSQLYAIEVSA